MTMEMVFVTMDGDNSPMDGFNASFEMVVTSLPAE